MAKEIEYANKFCDHCKMILSYARDIAYSLGGTTIEPIHLILGERQHQYQPGISDYLFKDNENTAQIIKRYTKGEPIVIPQPEELKEEISEKVQRIIRKSYRWVIKSGFELVEPYHMFIIMQKVDPYLFNDLLENEKKFNSKAFYEKQYGLDFSAKKPRLMQKILQIFKF
jgi:hypothetical protein